LKSNPQPKALPALSRGPALFPRFFRPCSDFLASIERAFEAFLSAALGKAAVFSPSQSGSLLFTFGQALMGFSLRQCFHLISTCFA